ncbi:DUF1289 domain-containing protein [Rhodobacterales bacterium HKCCE2091]|nr:DUF1289 domain-containing protein [Rhodobacterales bacterium HKCCE2091]
MMDEVWRRDEIASPCVKMCVIHPEARICIGCHRRIEEIAAWSRMTAVEREEVIAALPARGGLLRQRRGGRSRARARAAS